MFPAPLKKLLTNINAEHLSAAATTQKRCQQLLLTVSFTGSAHKRIPKKTDIKIYKILKGYENMKKITCAILAIISILCCFTACGGDNTPKEVDVNAVYNEVAAAVTIPDFIELTENDIVDYVAVDTADLKQMKVQISAEAISADQIVICEAVDAAAASRVASAFTAYLDSVKGQFKNYLPSEYAKMEDTEVQTSGNYVYYAVSSEADTIYDIFDKYFK